MASRKSLCIRSRPEGSLYKIPSPLPSSPPCRFEGAEEAFNIIKAGPEPLLSQFSASYGLVLNLLSVYTLEEARAFVQRSFGNFLQTEGRQRRLEEAARMEASARALMAEYKATASSDAKELNVSY